MAHVTRNHGSTREQERERDPRDPRDWSPARIAAFRRELLDFFGAAARSMPWRGDPDPYAILVSEFMLQQTRVGTVEPYFVRWMARFPDAESLADAPQEEVLRLWAGLGYYARARNLHAAVREIVQRYDGQVPSKVEALLALPGIGPYTAGAVASIAHGEPVPAVDGNARRVFSRLMDDPSPPPSLLHRWAGTLVDPVAPGAFNQAIMELGSTLCTPRRPRCTECPVATFCAALAAGTQEARPAPRPQREVPESKEAVAVLTSQGRAGARVLLRRRPEEGLLGGMWELPGVRVERADDARAMALSVAGELCVALGEDGASLAGEEPEPLAPLDHAFSHRRIRYLPFRIQLRPDLGLAGGSTPAGGEGSLRWVGPGEEGRVPLPTAQRTILARAW